MATVHKAHTNLQKVVKSAPLIDPQSVGIYFVKEFYTKLCKEDKQMYSFYTATSKCIHGMEGTSSPITFGLRDINALFEKSEFRGGKVLVSNIDSLSLGLGVFMVQVLGELQKSNNTKKSFVETFILELDSNDVFYCKSDILRFLVKEEDRAELVSITAIKESVGEEKSPSMTKSMAPSRSGDKEVQKSTKPTVQTELPTEKTQPPLISTKQPPKEPTKTPVATPSASTDNITPAINAKLESENKPEQKKPMSSSKADILDDDKSDISVAKSWANLAAINKTKWGSAVVKVEGKIITAPADQQTSPGTAPTRASNIPANPPEKTKSSSGRYRETNPIFVKSVPHSADQKTIRNAFSKFGNILNIEFFGSGSVVVDFETSESQKKALASGTADLGSGIKVYIEERRAFSGRRREPSKTGSGHSHGSRRSVDNDGADRTSYHRGGTRGRGGQH
ncbi:hypothetical protein BB559_002054 [Furculomyces boomerangus]|uniref:NTF2 domain-containing protein n=1 Tax=Furculomyces boomerangus TaxID=61424 RepID=A0A2T9YYJ1_9FUNG|nr:hypothetical protein BB559_002054 [Furculomyces boomerangus]